ncbi:hypothetical protein T439DRAFT_382026 [Meredithblackwellia eburnea MCA 4105]
MSSVQQPAWLNYIVTPNERESLANWADARIVKRFAGGSTSNSSGSLDAPLPQSRRPSEINFNPDDPAQLIPAISRRAIRLFAAIYTVANVYENLIVGLIFRRKSLKQFLKDLGSISALRLSLFVSLFSASYRLLLHRLRQSQSKLQLQSPLFSSSASPSDSQWKTIYRPSMRRMLRRVLLSPYLPPFLAGVIASPTMLIEQPGQRRITMALYAFTRAIQGGFDAGARKGVIPKALAEGRWWFGGHLLFAISNGILLHAFVFNSEQFPAAYSNFILKYSSAYLPVAPPSYPVPSAATKVLPWPHPRQIVDGITSCSRARYPPYVSPTLHPDTAGHSPLPIPSSLKPILTELTHPGHKNLTCAILHPTEISCWTTFDGFVKDEFKGAAKFFGALSLIGAALRWKKTLKDPEGAIFRIVLGTITSSSFLSLAIGTAWSTICLFQQYLPKSFIPTKRFYLQGFLAGLWVSLVDIGMNGASRATDLGMYTARMAIQCAWEVWVKQGKVKNIKNGDVLYFAISIGTLLSMYENNPRAIRSNFVRATLKQVGGLSTAESLAGGERERRLSTVSVASTGSQ